MATVLPFGGSVSPEANPAEKETIREELYAWIRVNKKFDVVVDFDKALQDPADPSRLRAEFGGGDHLHPNDAGAQAMADSIHLDLFSAKQLHAQ